MADEANPYAEGSDEPNPYAPSKPSMTESFLRGLPEGATFGYDDKLGFDKEAREASRAANPLTHFAGEAVGSLVPMAAAALLPTGATQAAAGTRAAYLLSRGAGLLRSALLPSTEARTLGQATLQGAKVGTTWGGLSGSGHADVNPEDSYASALLKRAKGALVGAGEGAGLGAGLGALGHGVGKLVSSAMTRSVPELNDILKTGTDSDLQAVREVMRSLGEDRFSIDDLRALQANLRDPAQAHRYANLNLLEALEARPLEAAPITGELKMPPVRTPAMSATMQDAANLAGAGRLDASQAFATRKGEMAGKIHEDIDRLFPTNNAAGNAIELGTGQRAADIEALPTAIDTTFGSGNAEANALATDARRASFNKRYNAIRSKGLQDIEGLTKVAQLTPMQNALKYAADNDMVRLATETGAEWTKPWSAGDLGGTVVTLSPANILDVHHALSTLAKPPITGATPESLMAGKLKNWFSDWVDQTFSRHGALREEYSIFKRSLEAPEQAAKLGSTKGAEDSQAMNFLRSSMDAQDAAVREVQKQQGIYRRAADSFENGRRTSPPKRTDLNRAETLLDGHVEVLDAFRRRWGENLKSEIASAATPEAAGNVVRKWLSPAGEARIRLIAGDQADGFISQLQTIEARNQGRALSLKGGGDDAAPLQFLNRITRDGNTEAVDAFRRAWGERIKNELNARGDNTVGQVVTQLLTPEGKRRILQLLGPDQGQVFIETLFNKQQQMGLGPRLYGNSDTAYKLARQKKMASASDLVRSLIPTPWTFSPTDAARAAHEIASSAFTQRRADQMNRLLSRQGPDEVSQIIDSIISRDQLMQAGLPYGVVPSTYAAGPAASGVTSQPEAMPPFGSRRPIPPYRQ